MSKKDKELQSMRNNTKNVRFKTLQSVLLNYKFTETAPGGGSSHYTYHRGIYRITVPKDHPVGRIYVKKALEIIDKIILEEEEK